MQVSLIHYLAMEYAVALGFAVSCLAAAVTAVAIGAILLRSSGSGVLDLIVQLPTLAAKEDTEEARRSIRRRARNEIICLVALRNWPAWLLIISGVVLLGYTVFTSLPRLLGPKTAIAFQQSNVPEDINSTEGISKIRLYHDKAASIPWNNKITSDTNEG